MKNTFTLVLVALFISCQSQESDIESINFERDYKFSSEIEEKVETDTVPWKYQFSAVDYASKGDYPKALKHWDFASRVVENTYRQKEIDSINSYYKKVDAKRYILDQAKSHQVVIINEAHHSDLHRFFTKSLLQELYNQGYRHLGLEALANGQDIDSLLAQRKYPTELSGWYIKAPQFGNLVREALEIGYELFPYEQTGNGRGKDREIAQARNIQKVIEQYPNEKFLIHCGFDHVFEGAYRPWEKTMTGRLTEYTGIDPFTINQVAFSERSDPKYNSPLLKAIAPDRSVILLDQDNSPYQYKKGEATTDVSVFHPNTNLVDGRPHWLFLNGNKKVNLDLSAVALPYPLMVYAFNKAEDINNAIPVDIVELQSKIENCIMALEKGEYTIVVTDGEKSVRFNKTIE